MLAKLFRSRLARILVIIVSAVLVGWVGWSIYYAFFVFHITGTTPNLNSVSNFSPYVKINFNQNLDDKSLDASIEPKVAKSIKTDGKSIVVSLNNLDINATYTITLKSVANTKGEQIQNRILTFVAKDIAYSSLSKDQQSALIAQQDYKSPAQSDPILSHLPHSTLTYNLSGIISAGGDTNTNTVSLRAELLLTGADMSDENSAIATYKQQVIDYVKSLGIDPNNYVIDYEVIEPAY